MILLLKSVLVFFLLSSVRKKAQVYQLSSSTVPGAAAKSLQSCQTLCDPIAEGAHQAPSSLGFSRQEHWSGLLFPSPRHESEK